MTTLNTKKQFPFERDPSEAEAEIHVILCTKIVTHAGEGFAGAWLEYADNREEVPDSYHYRTFKLNKPMLSRAAYQVRKLQDWMDAREAETGERFRICALSGSYSNPWKYDGLAVKHRLLAYNFAKRLHDDMTWGGSVPVMGGRGE